MTWKAKTALCNIGKNTKSDIDASLLLSKAYCGYHNMLENLG
jgi:hypothetical protein